MFNTNKFFNKGKLTTVMDGGAGSSGKGKISSFICEHADNFQFLCNTFMPNAGHWVKTDDGKQYFYQTFNGGSYLNNYEKIYIGPGSIIELPAFWREIEESNIDLAKIAIHPVVAVLQDIDAKFERGEVDLDGNELSSIGDGTMKSGSTCHGVGAARARRILRRPNTLIARDVPELKPFLCDTSLEMMNRLDSGQSGLLEIAQGFQLSYCSNFYPYCTSRNCTVSAALDDLMMPPIYAGQNIINFRTFPIRISNLKYVSDDGRHLTWEEVQSGVPHQVYEGNSGPGYDDQVEIDWDKLTADCGSPNKIIEMTSVTKLPRRAFTFSKKNVKEAVLYNRTWHTTHISINFANYVDYKMSNIRSTCLNELTPKFVKWLNDNIISICDELQNDGIDVVPSMIGTGALTDDMILI